MAQRYFLTAESTYEDLRQYLNTQLKYPNSLGKSIFQTALQAPRDNYRRILLAVDTSIANYDTVNAAIAPLLDSDAMEEVDEATYLAAVASATAGVASWTDITGTPTTLAGYGITDAAALVHAHSATDTTSGVFDLARLPYPVVYPVRAVHVGGVLQFNNGAYYVAPTYGTAGADISDLKALATLQFPSKTVAVDVSANVAQYIADNPGRTLTYASLEVALIDAANRIVGWGATSTNPAHNAPNGTAGTSMTVSLLDFPTLSSSIWILGGYNATSGNVVDLVPISAYKYCQSRHLDIEKTDWNNIPNRPTFATVATSGSAADLTGTLAAARLPATTVTAGSYGAASSVGTFTVDAAGRLTAAGSTAIAITSAQVSGLGTLATQSGTFSGTSSGTNTGDQTITLTGDVTGSGTGTFTATLANSGVSAGTYTSVTVDAKGRVTAGSSPAVAYSSLSGVPSTFAPSAHKSSHATGGSDALTASDIGAAASSHAHGNITSDGKVGSTSGQILSTTTGGAVTTVATVPTANLGSGTADNTTFLRGDQAYSGVSAVYEFTRSSKPSDATGSNGSYTWTVPATAKQVRVFMIGGGGGGGSGRRGAAGTARWGGGGGATANACDVTLSAQGDGIAGQSLTIAVAAGGGGGAARTTDDTNGANGTGGGTSSVTWGSTKTLVAGGGSGGSGGSATAGSGGGVSFFSLIIGMSGGASSVTGNASGTNPAGWPGSGAMYFAAAGGAGGGGISTLDVSYNGGQSRGDHLLSGNTAAFGFAAGTAPGGAGSSAVDSSTNSGTSWMGGSGSGGGAGNSTTAGGNGGNGGKYGGAGGGGGASFNGYNSGAGGNGADGYVRITVWF